MINIVNLQAIDLEKSFAMHKNNTELVSIIYKELLQTIRQTNRQIDKEYNKDSLKNIPKWTSSQDGGIGRYTIPPHLTKRRTTTNLKTKNNQN